MTKAKNTIPLHAIFFMLLFFCISCRVQKENLSGGVLPSLDLSLHQADWNFQEFYPPGIHVQVRNLKKEKLQILRDHFSVPTLIPMSLREAGSFSMYRIEGMRAVSNHIFIHPKLFVSSSTQGGSILGYKTLEYDSRGIEQVVISIPVALVNGLIPAIPIVGGNTDGKLAAIHLKEDFKILDPDALAAVVRPQTLETLPVCPTSFTLEYQGHIYTATSPFDGLSVCPVNQFFRIQFKAPKDEMSALLEAAAIQDDVVHLKANLATSFSIARKKVDLKMEAKVAHDILVQKLAHYENQNPPGVPQNGLPLYTLFDLENALVETLFDLSRRALGPPIPTEAPENGNDPGYSSDMTYYLSQAMDRFFHLPRVCARGDVRGGLCREKKEGMHFRGHVFYSWFETENIAAPIQTRVDSTLGAVANSTRFQSPSSIRMIERAHRPRFFQQKPWTEVTRLCGIVLQHLQDRPDPDRIPLEEFLGFDPHERPFIDTYCVAVAGYTITENRNDPEESDGYYPLGANTTVYPGAWLKIDIDTMEEWTTAKTREDAEGHVIIESEMKDLFSVDRNARTTVCAEGQRAACTKHQMKQVLMRDAAGNDQWEVSCERETPDCRSGMVNGVEVWTRTESRHQEVMDYDCDPQDEESYCPYFRTEERVVDYEVENECHQEQVGELTSFLCMGGCGKFFQWKCHEKSKKPILAPRQVPNCVNAQDPLARAPWEKRCKRPKYICETWNLDCTRYRANESFHIIHEEIAPKWRKFALDLGEQPKNFENQIYLKFVSPRGVVSHCRLDRFGRHFKQGNTIYIKIPTEANEIQPCENPNYPREGAEFLPIWNGENQKSLFLPKVYLKNEISYSRERLCGRTEYSVITHDIPFQIGRYLTPPDFQTRTEIHIGPLKDFCRAENSYPVGSDLWFRENPPIRFSGRVSVLGRMLESLVTNEL